MQSSQAWLDPDVSEGHQYTHEEWELWRQQQSAQQRAGLVGPPVLQAAPPVAPQVPIDPWNVIDADIELRRQQDQRLIEFCTSILPLLDAVHSFNASPQAQGAALNLLTRLQAWCPVQERAALQQNQVRMHCACGFLRWVPEGLPCDTLAVADFVLADMKPKKAKDMGRRRYLPGDDRDLSAFWCGSGSGCDAFTVVRHVPECLTCIGWCNYEGKYICEECARLVLSNDQLRNQECRCNRLI